MNLKHVNCTSLKIMFIYSFLTVCVCQADIFADDQNSLTSDSISDNQIKNLFLFSKVCGYVQYFHPSDEVEKTDWDSFTINSISKIMEAATIEEFLYSMNQIFRPIAPTLRLYKLGQPPYDPLELSPPGGAVEITKWYHKGIEFDELRSIIKREYQMNYDSFISKLISAPMISERIPIGYKDPNETFLDTLAGEIVCEMPINLFKDTSGTYPKSQFPNMYTAKTDPFDFDPNIFEVRLAAVIKIWNLMQHFYPYFDVVNSNWENILSDYLKFSAEPMNLANFRNLLLEMTTNLHDGHVYIKHEKVDDYYVPEIRVEWVEEKAVITYVSSNINENITVGDLLIKIDGIDIEDYIAAKEKLISGATPQWIRFRCMYTLLTGLKNTELSIEVIKANGVKNEVLLIRNKYYKEINIPSLQRPNNFEFVRDNLIYFDLTNTSTSEINANIDKMINSSGIIVDLRGYPTANFIPHLARNEIKQPFFISVINQLPNQSEQLFEKGKEWRYEADKRLNKTKKIYITDGRAISYSETILSIIKYHQSGVIIGEPTAGSNGNVNPIYLPGGFEFSYTGQKTLNRDNTIHHGIGVMPDFFVSRTINGIRNNYDEQLQLALQLLSETSVEKDSEKKSYQLYQNFPNPFNPKTMIKFSIPLEVKGERSKVKITVFDLLGREVAVLVDGNKQTGTYEVFFDSSNLPNGVYFYRLTAGNFSKTKKMMLLK